MYRYLVFAYYSQYPYGGMDDIVLKTNSIPEVIDAWNENSISYDYVHIYDCKIGIKYRDISHLINASYETN